MTLPPHSVPSCLWVMGTSPQAEDGATLQGAPALHCCPYGLAQVSSAEAGGKGGGGGCSSPPATNELYQHCQEALIKSFGAAPSAVLS